MAGRVDPDPAEQAAAADPVAAVRAMVDQWVSLSTAVADRTLGPGPGSPSVPFDLNAVATTLLGALNLPTRTEVLAVGAAVAALDARLARIEAAIGGMAPTLTSARSAGSPSKDTTMADLSQIREHMNLIGADGVHVGTVDKIDGGRIKLTKTDSTNQHHHWIAGGLVAAIDGNDVRLSANADVAVTFEEEA